jgi:hypothetical protein
MSLRWLRRLFLIQLTIGIALVLYGVSQTEFAGFGTMLVGGLLALTAVLMTSITFLKR